VTVSNDRASPARVNWLNSIEPMKLGCEYAYGEHDVRLDSDCQLVFTNLKRVKREIKNTCTWSDDDLDFVQDPQDVE
jgi:hypothetical protein